MSAQNTAQNSGEKSWSGIKSLDYESQLSLHIIHIVVGLLLFTYVGFNKKPMWLAKVLVGLLGLAAGGYHFYLIGKMEKWW